MESKNIILRQIALNDESQILDILTSDVVNQTYMLPDFTSHNDAIPLFHRLQELSQNKTRYVRGIYLNNQLIGFLNDVELENDSIELGYVIHPDFHGNGYMTQALKKAVSELRSMGFREVIAGAFEENIASIRVMEKAGMSRLDKTDFIEYRDKTHKCIYYHTVFS